MRYLILFAFVILSACAEKPTVYSAEDVERSRQQYEMAQAKQKADLEIANFLIATPHELCKGKDLRKRFGSTKECKEWAGKEQDRLSQVMAQQKAAEQAQQQMALQFLLNRQISTPQPQNFNYFQPVQPMQIQIPAYQPPPPRTNCISTKIGNTVQTNCQ